MSGSSDIKFTADESDLVKAQDKLIKQQQQQIDNYKKLATEAKKGGKDAAKHTANAAREMDRFAKATKDINRTPLERYADQMRMLNQSLKAGKIDQETFNRAVAKAKVEFQGAGQAGKAAFGSSAAGSLKNYMMGLTSISAAVGVFQGAMQMARAETDAALQSVERLIETRGQLQQVAIGPGGADVQAMNEFADTLSRRGISRAEAQSIIFSARSEGFAGQEDMVARLIAANQFKAADIRTLAGQVPTIFGGAVSPMQGIAGGAYGAKVSRLNVTEFAAMLPKGAQAGTILGGAPAETIALTSVLAGRSERSMEYAATLAGQLAFGKRGKEFEGLGVVGAVEKLSQMPEEQQRELLGTGKEANLIYKWTMQDMPRIKEVRAQAQLVMDNVQSYVSDVEGMVFDPNTQQGRLMIGRRESIQAANAFEIGQEQRLVEGGYARQATMSRVREEMGERGVSAVGRYGAAKAMEYADSVRAGKWGMEMAGKLGETATTAPWQWDWSGAISDLRDVARRMLGAADSQQEAASSIREAADESATRRQRAAAAVQPE